MWREYGRLTAGTWVLRVMGEGCEWRSSLATLRRLTVSNPRPMVPTNFATATVVRDILIWLWFGAATAVRCRCRQERMEHRSG